MEQQTPQVEVQPVNKAKVKNFIKVMLYLAALQRLSLVLLLLCLTSISGFESSYSSY